MSTVTDPAPPAPAAPSVMLSPASAPPFGGARSQSAHRIQLVLSACFVLATWISLRPFAFTGLTGVMLALLTINSIFLVARYLPDGSIPGRAELPLLWCWAGAAAALLCLRSDGLGAAFAYFVAGHAGYRLVARRALAVATGRSSSVPAR